MPVELKITVKMTGYAQIWLMRVKNVFVVKDSREVDVRYSCNVFQIHVKMTRFVWTQKIINLFVANV